MTGAASDKLTQQIGLGSDDGCCGTDKNGGFGCGKCMLVTTNDAINPTFKALVMKKNRCPPWSNGCSNSDGPHLDFAVPGFDFAGASTANICGNPGTYMTSSNSHICGNWWNYGSNTQQGCNCSQLPDSTLAEARLKKGCLLFQQWGWTTGTPNI